MARLGAHAAPARHKSRTRTVVIAAVCAAVLVALVASGVSLYLFYQAQQQHVAALRGALDTLAATDDEVLALDEAVADPLSDAASALMATVQRDADEANRQLDEAEQGARAVAAQIFNGHDKEAAVQVQTSAAARRTLLELGSKLVAAAEPARAAAERADELWDAVLDADEQVRAAAALVTDTTDENVRSSLETNRAALEALAAQRTAFAEVEQSYPAADFSAIDEYLATRIEALGYSIASDEAILARDTAQATAQNDLYNATEQTAAAQAEELPARPSALVADAFAQAAGDELDAYATARSQASSADAFIRDYLG